MTSTTTTKAPTVTSDMLVSVRIGSDMYAADIVRVTGSTVTVSYGGFNDTRTFRPSNGRWVSDGSYRLVLGVRETILDPHL